VLHVVVANNYEREQAVYSALTKALSARSQVQELVDPGPHQLFQLVASTPFDVIVCSVGATHDWGTSIARLHGPVCRNLMQGWMRLGTPVVFVSHFHPFVHLEFESVMDTVINTFGSLEGTAERVVRGITGKQRFTGSF
jgi:beta-N-acetylhexosaminidase